MKTLSESERQEIGDALEIVDRSIVLARETPAYWRRTDFRLMKAVRPILDYAKSPQNFPDKFIEDQALNIARAING